MFEKPRLNRRERGRLRTDDREDLASAHVARLPKVAPSWLSVLGPGLVTGAADDDPSGIGTYSVVGAQFGYALLWLVPICLPMMIAVQEMCGRMAAVTGNGLAAVIKLHYPKMLLWSCIGLLVVANVFNIYADLNVMASTTQMLFGLPLWAGLTLITIALVFTQILFPYRLYARILKWLCLALAGYAVVALMPGVHNNWTAIVRGLITPRINLRTDTILGVVAFLGTTVSPYLFFWQAGQTVEDEVAGFKSDAPGERKGAATNQEFRNIRADTVIGMVASQLVAFFIVIAAAGTLHNSGVTNINTAQDAAKALLPLGPSAYWIFALCMIGTGLLAIPTLAGSAAYSVAETFGWRYGLYRRFSRARGFYAVVGAVVTLGCLMNFVTFISPLRALFYSAALNGVVAPPLIVVLLFICNSPKILGSRTNGFWSNACSGMTVLVMGAAAMYLLYAMATGRA